MFDGRTPYLTNGVEEVEHGVAIGGRARDLLRQTLHGLDHIALVPAEPAGGQNIISKKIMLPD